MLRPDAVSLVAEGELLHLVADPFEPTGEPGMAAQRCDPDGEAEREGDARLGEPCGDGSESPGSSEGQAAERGEESL